jgi:3-oxoacyl-[acyl-carrier-protein] synthase-3
MIDPATGEHLINNSAMAIEATLDALAATHVEPEEVDLFVLSTASPDYLLPPLVTFVQEALGLRSCATIELRSGCAGAVEALDIARLYLERGPYKTAVVIGSEAISPLLAPVFLAHVETRPAIQRGRAEGLSVVAAFFDPIGNLAAHGSQTPLGCF